MSRAVVDAGRRGTTGPSVVLWLALGLLPLLLPNGPAPGDDRTALLLMGACSALFGVWVFLRHGGAAITAAGVFSLATAAFVGFAAMYWAQFQHAPIPPTLLGAAALAYFGHVVTWAIFWRRAAEADPGHTRAIVVDGPVARWASTFGTVMVVAGAVMYRVVPGGGIAVDAGVFVGVLLITIGLVGARSGARIGLTRYLAIGVAFAAYLLSTFDGYGRLTLIALGMGIATVVASAVQRGWLKMALLLAAPLAVWLLALTRQALGREQGVSRGDDPFSGLGSVVSPLETFARLLETGRLMEPATGETFVAAMTVFVPRTLWPDKPIGFGAELTGVLEPQLVASGHSMAALAAGEWYYNFRLVGLLAMVVVVGLLVRTLDRGRARAFGTVVTSRAQTLVVVAVATAIAGLPDYVWAGAFTYTSRTGFRLLLVGLLIVVFRTAPSGGGVRRSRAPRRRRAPSSSRRTRP